MSDPQAANYAPEIEHGNVIAQSFKEFGQSQLSENTLIHHVVQRTGSRPVKTDLIRKEDIEALNQKAEAPIDANKLRISEACFGALADRLMIPPAFVFTLSRHFLPNGRGSRKIRLNNQTAFDFWYFLLIRVQVPAGVPDAAGILDDAIGPSQMNPSHRLPLPGAMVDIRRSCVGIFSRIEMVSKRVTFLAFDFMHGGWPKVALEPSQRIEEVMKQRRSLGVDAGYGCYIHLVYLSSASRWWTNALNSIHEQLIIHELDLQKELDNGDTDGYNPAARLTQINRALHSIAAHLHRYLSELKSLEGVVVDLVAHYEPVYDDECSSGSATESFEAASRGLSQVLSQIEATHAFAEELEKIQNILALLFNRIRINSANLSHKMAEASHALAEEMKRDSVAMKTIAVVTMFFLPGATFAVSTVPQRFHIK
ncbi:hypothetical protein PFICI_10924 [Pestalotiopsis fici W106-1]|uniref:Uncharacterized protein n=1 Tax=Pestalotiopsis fici (strain W106-1 / CGMCC3.15140) TaxID=1229662 RepID=W3WT69_PESFW|nr:uncharacterized protein PFICI_10924 [Pestalotiopsis fici W106-1]ETS77050.1 hypothetical protein PFICI_10924 [Pestalotiopsis fici W106-1]